MCCHYYYSHFIGEKTGSERLSNMPIVTQPISVLTTSGIQPYPAEGLVLLAKVLSHPVNWRAFLVPCPLGKVDEIHFTVTDTGAAGLAISGHVTEFYHQPSIQLGHFCCPIQLPASQLAALQKYFSGAFLSTIHGQCLAR